MFLHDISSIFFRLSSTFYLYFYYPSYLDQDFWYLLCHRESSMYDFWYRFFLPYSSVFDKFLFILQIKLNQIKSHNINHDCTLQDLKTKGQLLFLLSILFFLKKIRNFLWFCLIQFANKCMPWCASILFLVFFCKHPQSSFQGPVCQYFVSNLVFKLAESAFDARVDESILFSPFRSALIAWYDRSIKLSHFHPNVYMDHDLYFWQIVCRFFY